MAFLGYAYINDIDVSNYLLNFKITINSDKPIDIATMLFREDIKDFIELKIGDNILIKRGESNGVNVFDGFITNINLKRGTYDIEVANKLWLTVYKRITKIYDKSTDPFQGRIDLIFIDLCQTAGLNADNTSVQSTGDFILSRLTCNNQPIFEVIEQLRKTMNWCFYHNPIDDKIYFEPVGFRGSEIVLTMGDNIINVPSWDYDCSQLGNVITIQSNDILVQDSLLFSGNDLNKEFNLTYAPRSIEVFYPYVDEGDKTRLTGGRLETSGVDYEIDVEKKVIKFATTPAAGSDNVQVVMSRLSPAIITVRDSDSIKKYNKEFERIIKIQNIITQTDLENAAKQYLLLFKNEFKRVTILVLGTINIQRGYFYRIIDAYNSQDEYLAVTSMTLNWPNAIDEVILGDKEWRYSMAVIEIRQRLNALESADTESGIVLNYLEQVNENISLKFNNFQIKQSTDAGVNWTWLCRRKFKFEDFDSFNEGTTEGNIDISYGDLRAGSQ